MEQDLYLHGLIGGAPAAEPLWVRPVDWLEVPELELTDDKVQLLFAIIPNTTQNYLAFVCTGNYTVDWGDGNTENVASGVKAQHQYDWNDIDPLTLTSDGYLQTLVVITPNGGVLSTVNFEQEHSAAPSGASNLKFFEFVVNCPSATQLNLTYFNESTQHIILGANNVTVWSDLFSASGLYRFQCKASMSHVTTMDYAFSLCNQLVEVIFDIPDFSSCGNFYRCFNYTNLVNAPEMIFNPNIEVWLDDMFEFCSSLKTVPAYVGTGGVTSITSMFGYCLSLAEVPLFDTSGVVWFDNMFDNCVSLKTVPLFDTSSGEHFYRMFYYAISLTQIPAFDTSAAVTMQDFVNGTPIAVIPAYNLSNCSDPNTATLCSASAYDAITSYNATGMKVTFSLANFFLDHANLINVFNNLASGVVAQTITVTGNPGAASLTAPDLAIATSKGWTVVT